MRFPDPDGPWIPHPDDARVLIPVPVTGVAAGTPRYRVLDEGVIEDFDGFSVPAPRAPEGLDLNRNFPAGWGSKVIGSGDHPLSEPEIDALVRAMVARPNICGFNAFHTSGGVLLRPSSTVPDAKLPPNDLWAWKQLAAIGTELTGYPSHSLYEDFTWDTSETMSGASDDWAYEHLGVFSWTTEFWDIVHAATGHKQSTHFWYTGPTDDERLAVARWLDRLEGDDDSGFVEWYPFEHPQLGPVELGGFNHLHSWTNPPLSMLCDEVDRHADFAVAQALAAPCLHVAAHGRGVRRRGDVARDGRCRQRRLAADHRHGSGRAPRSGSPDRRRSRGAGRDGARRCGASLAGATEGVVVGASRRRRYARPHDVYLAGRGRGRSRGDRDGSPSACGHRGRHDLSRPDLIGSGPPLQSAEILLRVRAQRAPGGEFRGWLGGGRGNMRRW